MRDFASSKGNAITLAECGVIDEPSQGSLRQRDIKRFDDTLELFDGLMHLGLVVHHLEESPHDTAFGETSAIEIDARGKLACKEATGEWAIER